MVYQVSHYVSKSYNLNTYMYKCGIKHVQIKNGYFKIESNKNIEITKHVGGLI